MTYKLMISEYAYSDNSMRAWLEVDAFGIPFRPRYVPMRSAEYSEALANHVPAASLPVLSTDQDGNGLIWEGAAVADILADRHADAGLWPRSPETREMARALAVRARTNFSSLQALPMNLHARYQGFVPSGAQQEDADA
ncbi:MAG: glutathione S-transferase N-terminal domain-containing protein, partial [Pseudomonadota bacterium]